jgi:hypothetical protein
VRTFIVAMFMFLMASKSAVSAEHVGKAVAEATALAGELFRFDNAQEGIEAFGGPFRIEDYGISEMEIAEKRHLVTFVSRVRSRKVAYRDRFEIEVSLRDIEYGQLPDIPVTSFNCPQAATKLSREDLSQILGLFARYRESLHTRPVERVCVGAANTIRRYRKMNYGICRIDLTGDDEVRLFFDSAPDAFRSGYAAPVGCQVTLTKADGRWTLGSMQDLDYPERMAVRFAAGGKPLCQDFQLTGRVTDADLMGAIQSLRKVLGNGISIWSLSLTGDSLSGFVGHCQPTMPDSSVTLKRKSAGWSIVGQAEAVGFGRGFDGLPFLPRPSAENIKATMDQASISGPISRKDAQDICELTLRLRGIDHRILKITADSPEYIYVQTGRQDAPLAGSGKILRFGKQRGKWALMYIEDWVS